MGQYVHGLGPALVADEAALFGFTLFSEGPHLSGFLVPLESREAEDLIHCQLEVLRVHPAFHIGQEYVRNNPRGDLRNVGHLPDVVLGVIELLQHLLEGGAGLLLGLLTHEVVVLLDLFGRHLLNDRIGRADGEVVLAFLPRRGRLDD